MAITPNSNEAFLREVDEELRRDQLTSFWQRWGKALIAAIVVGLAVLAGVLYWRHHQREAAGVEGEQLAEAYAKLGAGDAGAAAKPLAALSQSKVDGYRASALFTQADIALQKNDLKTAAAKFAAVAGDDGLAAPFRDLALVRQTAAEFDTLKPEVVIARLRGLAQPGNPWFGSAGELIAAAYIKQGRRDLAGQMFGRMAKDEGVPASIRQRAVQMAGVFGVDAVPSNEGATKQ